MAYEELFQELMSQINSSLSTAREVQQQVSSLSVEAKSEDGLIRLTVGPPGYLRKLELDPRVKRLELVTLAERIVEIVNNASRMLQEEMAGTVQSLMPDLNVAETADELRRIYQPPQ